MSVVFGFFRMDDTAARSRWSIQALELITREFGGVPDTTHTVYYAAENGTVVSVLSIFPGSDLEIYNLTTLPAARGRGAARALLTSVFASAPGRSFWVGVVPDNLAALRLYATVGMDRPRLTDRGRSAPLPVPFIVELRYDPRHRVERAAVVRQVDALYAASASLTVPVRVAVPWTLLRDLSVYALYDEREISGALMLQADGTYSTPLVLEDEASRGVLTVRNPRVGRGTVFVGTPVAAPEVTIEQGDILFHTHPSATYNLVSAGMKVSEDFPGDRVYADFPSAIDIVLLNKSSPQIMVSERGVWMYQWTPIFEAWKRTLSTTQKNILGITFANAVNRISTNLRWTADPDLMLYGAGGRGENLLTWFNDLTVGTLMTAEGIDPNARVLSIIHKPAIRNAWGVLSMSPYIDTEQYMEFDAYM